MINFFSALGTDALFEILKQSNDATAIYTGEEINIQFANDAMLEIWGKDESVRGKRFEDALPEMEGQPFTQLLKNVWRTGEVYEAHNTAATLEINGKMITSFFDFTYKPIKNKEGEVYCILHTATNVTERQKAWELVQDREDQLRVASEGLNSLNEELRSSNEDLATINKEYVATNKQLDNANRQIYFLNDQLKQENFHLLLDKKVQENDISDLSLKNKSLSGINNDLQNLNDTIVKLNEKLTTSEMSFRDLIMQAPVAMMLVKGDDYIVTMINVTMLELIGKDVSIVGKPLFEELPELKGQRAANMLVDTYEKGLRHSDEANPVTLNRNGQLEQGYFNFSYTPYVENGVVTGVIDMALEVTTQIVANQKLENTIREKIKLEESLRNSEQRLRAILETMAEGVGVTDATGQMVYANPMAQQILGLKESEIKKRTYYDALWQNLRIDGTPLPPEEHPMAIMMTTKKPVFDYEIAVQPPDRDKFYLSINAAPMFDSAGNLIGGIGTFMDVTARRLASQGKDDFISIASHELKTPVTALKASLQLLQRATTSLSADTRARLLEQSVKSLDKLTKLIDGLLDTSRMDHGQLKLNKQSFIISELFEDCCSNFAQNTDQKITFEGDVDQEVIADHQQIGQVMVNFINNAIKYAPESDILIKAEVLHKKEVKFSVRDQGPGIPEDKIGHLFERYYRTNYQGQKFSGLGLGLYICADIIKNHGGKIGVESEVGKGTTFWFILPL
ncbi:ATP-binding protein [Epilithonimonas zeae]|uniref:histidine kinase n=1 Tax=Epilithonimonas zeae TaxID=1416779 RepID=A0A1N6GTW9_9FLAO|nr:ATP-binding protein [Epilithonimonas zeae]SIO10785.1 PAS domain S-box-containing protein [Epilithonimonas zeae]